MPVVVSLDGAFVAPEQAAVSVFDRGLLYGDGCFEVLRTWDGVAVELDAHLERLLETARFLSLRSVDRDALRSAVMGSLERAGSGDHRVRIVLTRGPGALGVPASALGPGRTIVIVEPLAAPPTEVSIAVVDWPIPRRIGPGHKTLAYVDHLIARELASGAGADEAIRLAEGGHVVEGSTCNVFTVTGGAVSTPPVDGGALPGVVRARVLSLCDRLGIAAAPSALTVTQLHTADELFVTSSLRGVVPVTRVDGHARAAGPVTETIARAYVAEMRAAAQRIAT